MIGHFVIYSIALFLFGVSLAMGLRRLRGKRKPSGMGWMVGAVLCVMVGGSCVLVMF